MERPDFADPADADRVVESKFRQKFRESPFMVFGLAGSLVTLGYGAYAFRKRKMRPSIFLMQLRVAAQSAIVGMLALGCGLQLYNRLSQKKIPNESSNN